MAEKRSTHITSFSVAIILHLLVAGILYYTQVFSKIEIPQKEIGDKKLEMNFALTKRPSLPSKEYSGIKIGFKNSSPTNIKMAQALIDKSDSVKTEMMDAEIADEAETSSDFHTSTKPGPTFISSANELQDGDDRILNYMAPRYPMSARRKGTEGLVTVQFYVDLNGEIEQLTITKSSGDQTLDETVISAVKKWKFKKSDAGFKASKTFEFKLK